MYIAHQHLMNPTDALAYAVSVGVGELVTSGLNGLNATRVPFVVVERDSQLIIQTHLNRVNPQVNDFGEALLIVTGADAHIPGHYLPPEKPESMVPSAPTWDYVTVHLRGPMVTFDDPDWKRTHWDALVEQHEKVWTLADPKKERLERVFNAVVGVEITITEQLGKAKLHQNLASDDISALADKLESDGDTKIAGLMRDISVPWAQAREARVEKARRGHTAPEF